MKGIPPRIASKCYGKFHVCLYPRISLRLHTPALIAETPLAASSGTRLSAASETIRIRLLIWWYRCPVPVRSFWPTALSSNDIEAQIYRTMPRAEPQCLECLPSRECSERLTCTSRCYNLCSGHTCSMYAGKMCKNRCPSDICAKLWRITQVAD